ncbi:hypothetical protein NDU88_001360 [Pleurodeles waltl]|uniref:Uncharacterized protein n=1 Tax=Pleurodeles waltl TaxID=8319 RepID=A0AAV7R8U0_PLEWA|nr:hypothetical protein NDU88_001360 [Pleurodeles waltl]
MMGAWPRPAWRRQQTTGAPGPTTASTPPKHILKRSQGGNGSLTPRDLGTTNGSIKGGVIDPEGRLLLRLAAHSKWWPPAGVNDSQRKYEASPPEEHRQRGQLNGCAEVKIEGRF